MITINPYLNFQGNTEEVFNFYKSVFGGEFSMVARFKDMPGMGELSEADGEKLMHISLPIGSGNMLMGSDSLESQGHPFVQGTNISLSLHPDTRTEADRLFIALSEGGTVTMPIADVPWGYFGMCTDKYGIQWRVNCDAQA